MEYHLDLAARLAPLREKGVMIVASGNVVHNLQLLRWREPTLAFDWAERFDDATVALMTKSPADALRLQEHPDYALAVPTPDHFIPLLYVAGLAAAEGVAVEPLLRGYSMGSISMSCFGIGADVALRKDPGCAARLPEGVPPDQTNM